MMLAAKTRNDCQLCLSAWDFAFLTSVSIPGQTFDLPAVKTLLNDIEQVRLASALLR
jgi:hypothetical protein